MAKSKDDSQSTKSTKTQSRLKTIASSLVNKAKSGLATLKHKAMEVLSPKKKKLRIPETQVREHASIQKVTSRASVMKLDNDEVHEHTFTHPQSHSQYRCLQKLPQRR